MLLLALALGPVQSDQHCISPATESVEIEVYKEVSKSYQIDQSLANGASRDTLWCTHHVRLSIWTPIDSVLIILTCMYAMFFYLFS